MSYPVGRSRFALAALALAWLACVATAAAWTLQSAGGGWRQALAWAAVLACGLVAALAWLRSPVGTLDWAAGDWRWLAEGGAGRAESGRPAIALDLQSRLLLRWHADGGGVRWLVLERASAFGRWEALRRAVYSRPSTDAPQGAPPPVA